MVHDDPSVKPRKTPRQQRSKQMVADIEEAAAEDTEATAMQEALDVTGLQDATGLQAALEATGDLPDLDEAAATGISKALSDDDATQLASLDDEETAFAPLDDDEGDDTAVDLDASLLDATGRTQVLTEDMAVQTASDVGANLSDGDATMLANGLDDDETAESIEEHFG